MTYTYCKAIISKGNYVKDEILEKLDVFLLANRLTKDEYNELVSMLNIDTEN